MVSSPFFLWCFTSYPEDPCMVAIFTYIYHKNEPHVGINIPFFHGSYKIDNLIVQGDAQKTPLKTRGKNWSSSGGEASRQNEQNFTPLKTNDWLAGKSTIFAVKFRRCRGRELPSRKLTWHWKVSIFNGKYIFNWWFLFHCHSLVFEGGSGVCHISSYLLSGGWSMVKWIMVDPTDSFQGKTIDSKHWGGWFCGVSFWFQGDSFTHLLPIFPDGWIWEDFLCTPPKN